DAPPRRELLDKRGNLHAVFQYADLRKLRRAHGAARERNAKRNNLWSSGRNICQWNELHIDAADRLRRREELRGQQMAGFDLFEIEPVRTTWESLASHVTEFLPALALAELPAKTAYRRRPRSASVSRNEDMRTRQPLSSAQRIRSPAKRRVPLSI